MLKFCPKSQYASFYGVSKSPITKGLIKAQEVNAKFFELTNKEMQKGYVTVKDLKTALLKFLPQNYKLKIKALCFNISKFLFFCRNLKAEIMGLYQNPNAAAFFIGLNSKIFQSED